MTPTEVRDKAAEWKRKFKGTGYGGAYIHTHPSVERAIVENHNGISFNGLRYMSLDAAKCAALANQEDK